MVFVVASILLHAIRLRAQTPPKVFSMEFIDIDTAEHMIPSSALPGAFITDTVASSIYLGSGGEVCNPPQTIYLQHGSSIIPATLDTGTVFPDTLILSFKIPADFDTGSYSLFMIYGLECAGDTEITPSAFIVGVASGVELAHTTTTSIQIYPNPFSQSTQITFTSLSVGYADVSIVNMLGVEVGRLFSGELGVGEHSFSWDAEGTSAPQGMYECVVRMNGKVETLAVVKF